MFQILFPWESSLSGRSPRCLAAKRSRSRPDRLARTGAMGREQAWPGSVIPIRLLARCRALRSRLRRLRRRPRVRATPLVGGCAAGRLRVPRPPRPATPGSRDGLAARSTRAWRRQPTGRSKSSRSICRCRRSARRSPRWARGRRSGQAHSRPLPRHSTSSRPAQSCGRRKGCVNSRS